MKYVYFLLLFSFPLFTYAQNTTDLEKEKLVWWQDAKFGLFLHWGLYSATAGDWKGRLTSRGEHFMLAERIPVKEYAMIADTFNPVHFDAEKWVFMAEKAGMKYIVITAKHHDGFAMYDSKSSEYNIVKKTPYAHDPMKDLSDACHKHGLKFGFYYSLGRDWEDPDAATNWPTKGGRSNTWDFPDEDAKDVTKYYKRKVLPQLKELLTQYGTIDILWFDTPELTPKWESKEIRETILQYQPNCIINSRIGNGYGDYTVYEQSIVDKIINKPWESCVTISANWSYNKHDLAFKSSNLLVRQLVDIVSKGGNYLLNLSPKGDGTFANEAVSRVDSVGDWLRINGDAIYGAKPWTIFAEIDSSAIQNSAPVNLTKSQKDALDAVNDATSKKLFPAVYFTKKENDIYVIVCNPKSKMLNIKSLSTVAFGEIKSISLLGSSKKVKFKQTSEYLNIPISSQGKIPVYVYKIQ